ncbi:MAG: hypothetical protein GF344_00185 [Chitinivibrionales bacterium]|nr:hypothetical protein [Chitinivibrionales bacterium]MBD3355549.1 hypothetical protein [Chitinivibrionales bacterium]
MSHAKSLREVNIQLRARGKNKALLSQYQPLLEKGTVTALKQSPVYEFVLNGVEIGTFTGDVELTYADGRREVIVCSQSASPEQPIMTKLLKAFYNVDTVVENT